MATRPWEKNFVYEWDWGFESIPTEVKSSPEHVTVEQATRYMLYSFNMPQEEKEQVGAHLRDCEECRSNFDQAMMPVMA